MRTSPSVPRLALLPHANGSGPRIALLAGSLTPTNARLLRALVAQGADVGWLAPEQIPAARTQADVVLSRFDVRPTLDGVEAGWWRLCKLERAGFPVLNPTAALLACHDKLATALLLARHEVPHPRTSLIDTVRQLRSFAWPVVVKPRFGSWGRNVELVHGQRSLEQHLKRISREPWFRRHGALVQELVPTDGSDLRLVIAGGSVVGAVKRVAGRGEWRTNVSLGGRRHPVTPSAEARALAVSAVRAVGADLAGVDLLRRPDGGYVVLEVNGAVEFTSDYSLDGIDAFDRAARLIAQSARAIPAPSEPAAAAAVA